MLFLALVSDRKRTRQQRGLHLPLRGFSYLSASLAQENLILLERRFRIADGGEFRGIHAE